MPFDTTTTRQDDVQKPEFPASSQGTWASALTDMKREHGFEPLKVTGCVPAELKGTLYRNGAMQFGQFGRRYKHWFEGDGGVVAVRLDGGRAEGAVRLIETQGLKEERDAGRLLSGWAAPWWTRAKTAWSGRMKVQANTNAQWWDGRLLALMESGQPVELDPHTLKTLGATDLDGALIGPYSAHPHVVAANKTLFNIGVRYGLRTFLDFYAWKAGSAVKRLTSVPLPAPTMVHDFMATERHLVALVSPARLLAHRALLLAGRIDQLFAWEPQRGTEVIVVPLDDPERVTRFSAEPFWQWHFSNGYSDGDNVIVDFCRYDNLDTLWSVGRMIEQDAANPPPLGDVKGQFVRASIDVARKSMSSVPLADIAGEFPRVDPRKEGERYRYAWMTAGPAPGFAAERIVKVDVDTGLVRQGPSVPSQLPSEPIFVPRPGGVAEDDGWLLYMVYEAADHTSHLCIADAAQPENVLARAHFDHHVPPTFHGNWAGA